MNVNKPGSLGLILFLLVAALGILVALSACVNKDQTTTTTPATTTTTASNTATPTPTPVIVNGLNSSITGANISSDGKITVSYKLTDDAGNPVTRKMLDANRERFSMARIVVDPDTGYTQWLSYVVADVKGTVYNLNGVDTQPALPLVTGVPVSGGDSGGVFTEVTPGQYTYTFKTVLPVDYDKNATTRAMYQASADNRTATTTDTYDFVPAGGDIKITRQVIATENCNKCHDPLVAHGSRKDTKLCVICHTPQNVDPESGNSVDFKSYIHKLHDSAGKSFNIGTSDLSNIVWPQDVRNCTTCHSNAPNADNYKNNPSRAACGACHDQIDWTTGKSTVKGQPDHAGGIQLDDKACVSCHPADSGQEFDASVVGAHVIPAHSNQLKGVNYNLVAATVQGGQPATVDFNIKDNAGNPIDPNKMNSLSLTLAWPTTDYSDNLIEAVNSIPAATAAPFKRAGTLTQLPSGDYRYTFGTPIPPTWTTGSVGVSIVGYKNTTIKGNYGKDTVVREGNVNPVIYASLDNSAPEARRTVVDRNKCNSCHLDLGSPAGLAIHGGARRNTQTCVQCHIVTLYDEARHPVDQMPPESLHLDYMIHSIHMGEDRATATNFNGAINTAEVLFPGNRADCLKCHNAGTYSLPLPAGELPQIVTQAGQVVSITQPITAACAGCHAGDPLNGGFEAHAASMTTIDKGETCADCHGTGQVEDVVTVHAP